MATREFLILSATEPDRLGLIAELTGFIADRGCNIEDSRVAVLGGYAGLMFLISGEPEQIQAVVDDWDHLREQTGVRAVMRRVGERPPSEPAEGARYRIIIGAIDHEGIVHALADLVRRHGGNILELETATESAPMSGEPLLSMDMTVVLPEQGGAAERLERELRAQSHAEGMDLEITRLEPAPS